MTIVHWNVIHCPNVYSSAWASALFILGRWACEGLVRGINDEFEIPALLFLCFLGLVNLVRCRYPPKFKVKTTQKNMTKNNRKEYNAPMVEVLAARVERGFEGSLAPTGSNEDLISSGEVHGGSDFD